MDEMVDDFFDDGGFQYVEIDPDYEFDAARYFDFTRPESPAEAQAAELWFEKAYTYPHSRKDKPRKFSSLSANMIFNAFIFAFLMFGFTQGAAALCASYIARMILEEDLEDRGMLEESEIKEETNSCVGHSESDSDSSMIDESSGDCDKLEAGSCFSDHKDIQNSQQELSSDIMDCFDSADVISHAGKVAGTGVTFDFDEISIEKAL
ncbi:hypothetical protein ACLOJK_033511 [Asimina triloba]